MGDLTTNLSRSEFACPCDLPKCSRTPVDYVLASTIQEYADLLLSRSGVVRVIVHINSGLRCLAYDAAMKDKTPADFNDIKVSEHVWGIASDCWFEIVFANGKKVVMAPEKFVAFLEEKFPNSCGIGQYDSRTHFDTRPTKARWDNRGK